MKIKNNKRVFLCSDHHFGQENFYKFNKKRNITLRPQFPNASTADKEIISRHNSIVPEKDSVVFFLGDTVKDYTYLSKFDKMNGEEKYLVMGNHDSKISPQLLLDYFDSVFGAVYLGQFGMVLTHVPIHPLELRGMKNGHGHVHIHVINDPRYLCACLEPNDYCPIEIFRV